MAEERENEAQIAMIACKECATENSLDSAFCKKCGKPLAPDETEREKLEKSLDEGFQLFHHGRTDDAWLIAESSLAADPENLRALSLKGLILERRGMVFEALECFETIVKKDKDAALERMKLQSLRGTLDRHLHPDEPDRRMALAIAVCVVLVIGSISSAFFLTRQKPAEQQAVVQNTPGKTGFTVDPFTTKDNDQTANDASGDSANQTTDDSNSSDNKGNSNQAANNNANTAAPKAGSDVLDSQGNKPLNPLNGEIKALPNPSQSLPAATANTNVGAASQQPQNTQSDPDPSAVASNNSGQETKPQDPPAIVDIKLSGTGSNTTSPSNDQLDKNGVEALVRTARGQYQVGSYAAAAASYERALGGGADPGMINQRLGQCYEKLGRMNDAAAAYSRAISAIQSDIDSGRGDKHRLLAALDSSRQALKNLQGG